MHSLNEDELNGQFEWILLFEVICNFAGFLTNFKNPAQINNQLKLIKSKNAHSHSAIASLRIFRHFLLSRPTSLSTLLSFCRSLPFWWNTRTCLFTQHILRICRPEINTKGPDVIERNPLCWFWNPPLLMCSFEISDLNECLSFKRVLYLKSSTVVYSFACMQQMQCAYLLVRLAVKVSQELLSIFCEISTQHKNWNNLFILKANHFSKQLPHSSADNDGLSVTLLTHFLIHSSAKC